LNTSSPDASLSRRAAERIVAAAVEDGRLERAAAERLGGNLRRPGVLDALLEGAGESKRRGKGDIVSVSRNLFIPLTNLCRDRCA
jgi:2-iminoacetate synthase ThiH